MADAIMRDGRSAMAAGMQKPTRETCMRCHQAHGEKFDFDGAMKKIAHPTKPAPMAPDPRYKNPVRMALRPDGREIYVTCEAADSVIVVDPETRMKVAEIPVGGNPTGVAFTPDGRRAFVTNRLDDTVSVIDTGARKVIATLKTGNEPHGVLADRAGKLLYVLNTSSNDISVFDIRTLQRIKDLSGGNGPWSLALSPDGQRIVTTNVKSAFAPLRQPFQSEITEIETDRGTVDDRIAVPDANLMMGVAWHPSGEIRARHAEPHEEYGSHDALVAGLDDYQWPGGRSGATGASTKCCWTNPTWAFPMRLTSPAHRTAAMPWSRVPVRTASPWWMSKSCCR